MKFGSLILSRTVDNIKKSSSIMEVLHSIRESFGALFEVLFETITTDKWTEFSRLPELEEACGLSIYYAHPIVRVTKRCSGTDLAPKS